MGETWETWEGAAPVSVRGKESRDPWGMRGMGTGLTANETRWRRRAAREEEEEAGEEVREAEVSEGWSRIWQEVGETGGGGAGRAGVRLRLQREGCSPLPGEGEEVLGAFAFASFLAGVGGGGPKGRGCELFSSTRPSPLRGLWDSSSP